VKTQLIQLEPHDDTISVKDKMDWSQTPRVLLEWPDKGKILQNRLDLVLLERYCSTNGSQLALLTKDQQVIDQAEEAGIPVFQIRSEAQLQPWGKSFREFIRQEVVLQSQQPREKPFIAKEGKTGGHQLPPWARILLFTLAVAAVLAIGGTLLPSATVSLSAGSNKRDIIIPIQTIRDQEGINISGIIPSRVVEIIVEDQASLPATGTLSIPAEYARGEVVFTNLGETSIHIPLNTILSTAQENSPLFFTLGSGTTPEGRGAQINLSIEALEPGILANLPENMITRMHRDLGAELSVTNPSPTTGGEDIIVPAPSDKDRTLVGLLLSSAMIEMALESATQQLDNGDILLSSQPESSEITLANYQPEIGSAGNTLTLTNIGQYNFSYASADDLINLAERAVNALYTGGLFKPALDTISLTHLSEPEYGTDQIARWEMQVSWNEYRVFNKQKIIQIVLGKKPADAEKLLKNSLDLDLLPDVQVIPSWWMRIPVLPFRITIIEEGE
jgi:hypothetical protein